MDRMAIARTHLANAAKLVTDGRAHHQYPPVDTHPDRVGGAAREETTMGEYHTLSGAEFMRAVRDDPDKWADAAMEAAKDLGYKLERDWIRSLLADAMEAARQGSIRQVIEGDAST